MFQLREYQENSVRAGVEYLRNVQGRKGILVAPTGSGKSLIIANIAKELGSTLVLQPSKELLEQNYAKFVSYGGEAGVFSASMKQKIVQDVTFATIGSIKNRADLFADIRNVLIDECHLVNPSSSSMYNTFFNNAQLRTVGLSATPFRLKNFRSPQTGEPFSQLNMLTRMRPAFFQDIVHVVQIKDLYEQGYLSPIKYIPLAWDGKALVVNTTGADYTEESVENALDDNEILKKVPSYVAGAIEQGRKHIIVYTTSIQNATDIADLLNRSKYKGACSVSSQTDPKERERILTDFKAGRIHTVVNVGVLTTGFDFPELDTIIIARPTMSLSLYMQMIGRGVRLAPNKENCAVIEMCGNYNRFGKVEGIEYHKRQNLWTMTNEGKVLSNTPLVG